MQLKDQFSAQLKSASQTLSDFQKQTKYVASDMRKVGKNTENIGETLMTHVTVPLVGIGAAALKTSNDFQDGMAKVSTIADTTKVSMDTLNKGVIDLSNQTGLSVNELAEAEYQALSASVDTGKVTEFLGVATKAAKGGFTDTATAVNGLTNVLNAYGMEADKANKIANQMLITQNLGKTTFGELSRSMGKVTPVAANLGVKTEELFSSLAVTTAQGLDTAESVTAIKAAMSNIIKPSKEASEAAEQLGIDFSVSALKSKGWIGFLKDVKKGLANASPEFKRISNRSTEIAYKMANMERAGKKSSKEYKELKKQSKGLSREFERLAKMSDSPIGAMAQMFGSVEGLNSILMLTSDQGIEKYNEAMKQMRTNTTAVQDAYGKIQTPAEKFRQSLNRAKNSLLGAGGALAPTMETLGKVIDKITSRISKLTPKQQETIVKFGLITAGVGPVIFAIGKTTVGISNTIKGINNLQKGIKKAGGVMKYFTSPGHKAVLIMTALAMVAILVITNWDKIRGCFNKVAKTISKATGMSDKSVKKLLKGIMIGLPATLAVGKLFGGGFGSVFKILGKTVGFVTKGMIKILAKFFAFMLANPLVATITVIIGVCVLLYEAWKHNWGGIRDKTKVVVDFCKQKIESIKGTFESVKQKCIEFGEKIKGVWNGIKTFLSHPIQGTISLVQHGDLSGVKGKNALGTSYWGGGLSVVGEHGPEIVEMPSGSKVYDNKDSKRMVGKGGDTKVVFTGDIHVRKESDIDAIANAIVKKLQIQRLNMA